MTKHTHSAYGTNAGSSETMSNEEMNALIIGAAVEQYGPIITEGKTKTIEAYDKLVQVPITPEERIAEAAEFVNKLTIAGIEDKKNYTLAKQVLSGVKKWRTGIEAKRKELKAVALEYGRKVDGEAKRLTELVSKVESELTTKVNVIDKAIEEAAKAEQLRRHKLLTEAAWQFTGAWYICGVHTIDAATMPAATEEQLTEWLAIGQAELDRLEAERIRKDEEAKAAAEAARKAAEDAKRLAEENARKDAELAEMRAKLAAMEEANKPKPEPVETLGQAKGVIDKFIDSAPPRMFEGHPRPTGFEIPADAQIGTAITEPEEVVFERPKVGSVTAFDYGKGFEDCRAQVIAIFADGVKRTRDQFIQEISNLRPKQ